MNSKLGLCETCQKETTIYQITKKETFPNGGHSEEWWSCDPCVSTMYDDMVRTFTGREPK